MMKAKIYDSIILRLLVAICAVTIFICVATIIGITK